MKKNVLVTGANGLLGYEFLNRWRDDINIFALVKNPPQAPFCGVRYIPVDLSADWDVSILPDSMDVIVHLAQSPDMRSFPDAGESIYNVNTTSTAKLLNYGYQKSIEKFIFTSTGGLYKPTTKPFTEDSEIEPPSGALDFYFRTKKCSEELLESYKAHFKVTIVRPFFIYGPRQNDNMLIPRLIKSIREGKSVSLANGVGAHLNPIYVSDAAKVLAHLVQNEGPAILNMAGPEVVTITEIAQLISRKTEQDLRTEILDSKESHIVSDISLLRSICEFEMHSVEAGIRKMLNGGLGE
ncbi:NAD-dependent epimerase/dehydratase family protein [Terasakiella pusilla]|uniref:NAD-dependent epimerase/dehydratase family protein n=1 Tax=Terasakiella pusilla TaxID=64973 RepID=UPI003AA9404B